jgi:hypothetical protein
MNQSGHYEHISGQGWVKTSEAIPVIANHVFVPKGDLPHYDPSLRMRIESRAHKRQVLKESGLKEGGIIRNPDKRWDGPTKNSSKPTLEQKSEWARRQAWIQSQGGVNGLLHRVQRGGL